MRKPCIILLCNLTKCLQQTKWCHDEGENEMKHFIRREIGTKSTKGFL